MEGLASLGFIALLGAIGYWQHRENMKAADLMWGIIKANQKAGWGELGDEPKPSSSERLGG